MGLRRKRSRADFTSMKHCPAFISTLFHNQSCLVLTPGSCDVHRLSCTRSCNVKFSLHSLISLVLAAPRYSTTPSRWIYPGCNDCFAFSKRTTPQRAPSWVGIQFRVAWPCNVRANRLEDLPPQLCSAKVIAGQSLCHVSTTFIMPSPVDVKGSKFTFA